MILLLGGTSDSVEMLKLLIDEGFQVIFSMATQTPMELPGSRLVRVRRGAMNEDDMEQAVIYEKVDILIDATHPYAAEVTRNARKVSAKTSIRYFRLTRTPVVTNFANVILAKDHVDAAKRALQLGGNILVTIGIRNLDVYVSVCKGHDSKLIVRALPNHDSLQALSNLGVPAANIITAKGPFSYEDNVRAIREFGIKTLVTKDSGTRGGTEEKIRAAQDEGCNVIVVQRPALDDATGSFSEPQELLFAVRDYLTTMSSNREGAASRTIL
ncbi:MAG: precorrin-6A reductase [Desulfomonilaceae bacterium]